MTSQGTITSNTLATQVISMAFLTIEFPKGLECRMRWHVTMTSLLVDIIVCEEVTWQCLLF